MSQKSSWMIGILLALALVAGFKGGGRSQAVAAPEVSSGTFSIAYDLDTQSIFTSGSAAWTGITVAVTGGTAQVESLDSGNWVSLGSVATNRVCVFEGQYTSVRVKALAPSTTGTYSNRGPTDVATDADHAIGVGSVSIGQSPSRVFSTTSSLYRTIYLTVTTGVMKVRTSNNGSDLIVVSVGRSGSYRAQASEFWLVGSGTAAFTILDDPSEGTWMLLPPAHWSDEFSPLYTDVDGGLLEGDPNAPDDAGEAVVSRSVWDEDNEQYDTVYYVDNEALVTFLPTTTASTIRGVFEGVGVDIDSAWFEPDPDHTDTSMSWFHIRIPETSDYYGDLPGLLDYLNGLSCVEEAGYNDIGNACGSNPDQYFFHLDENQRIVYDGENELVWLHARDAWFESSQNPETGEGIGVVVIDSGVDVVEYGSYHAHPDLKNKVFKYYGYKVGIYGPDSKSLVSNIDKNSSLFYPPTGENDYGHGTCVAGIIGAANSNDDNDVGYGIGIASCGYKASIFVAKANWKSKGTSGGPTAGSVVTIIKRMKKDLKTTGGTPNPYSGLRVVCIAHAWEAKPPGLKGAIRSDISANNRLYVAAAGDTHSEKKMYPAYWDTVVPGLLGVTAANNTAGTNWGSEETDFRDAGSTFWNDGPQSSSTTPTHYRVSGYWHFLTTDMQGNNGYSYSGNNSIVIDTTTVHDSDYVDFGGTSAAAAQVAALGALIYGKAIHLSRLYHTDGTNDITASDVADIIANNLKGNGDPLPFYNQSGKTVPAVVDFKSALDAFTE